MSEFKGFVTGARPKYSAKEKVIELKVEIDYSQEVMAELADLFGTEVTMRVDAVQAELGFGKAK